MEFLFDLAQTYLHPIYSGLDRSALAAWVKASTWIVPWAGALHLLALGTLGGAILMVDMRVLGAGLTSRSPAKINRMARPLTVLALSLAIASGLVLASSEMMKIYYSPPYWLKMASLAAALTLTFGVRDRILADGGRIRVLGWLLAALSIALWAGTFLSLSNNLARGAMVGLLLALGGFAWVGARRERIAGKPRCPSWTKAISIISIAMWLTAATAGRWIAFY